MIKRFRLTRNIAWATACGLLIFGNPAPANAVPPKLSGSMTTITGRPSSTAVVSIVATDTAAPGYVQVLPCGSSPGASSNVNVDRVGQTIAGLAFVNFEAAGKACVFNQSGMNLVVDVQGYMNPSAFDDITDTRILDTRNGRCPGAFYESPGQVMKSVALIGQDTPAYADIPLDVDFSFPRFIVGGGCTAYSVSGSGSTATISRVAFSTGRWEALPPLVLPAVLAPFPRPTVIGLDLNQDNVWIAAFEPSKGMTVWKVPINGASPVRQFIFPLGNPFSTAITADGGKVYSNTSSSGDMVEYDTRTGTQRSLPPIGAFLQPIELSPNGLFLCTGQNVLSINDGAVNHLAESCAGWLANGNPITVGGSSSASSISEFDITDLSKTGKVIATGSAVWGVRQVVTGPYSIG